jgi:hypothetical protein
MTYVFIFATLFSGLIHEIEVTGFQTKETCQVYAGVTLEAFSQTGHQILQAECVPIEKGA